MSVRSDRSFAHVKRVFAKAPTSTLKRMTRALNDDGREWEGDMIERMRSGVTSGGGLRVRSGALRRSLGYRVTSRTQGGTGGIGLRVFSAGVTYAPIQELGGVITPKRAKWLTIPLPPNMTPAGVTRLTAREVINKGGFFATSKKGNLLIFNRAGEPQFVLKKKVRIPKGRLGFVKTWDRNEPSRFNRHRRALRLAIKDARGGLA